jgi:hypothetical protein
MFTHTKSKTLTEVNCSPGASTEVVKKEKKATVRPRIWQAEGAEKAEKKKPNQTPPRPATAEKNKIKQPHICLALTQSAAQAP